jgi:hypothetical protein
MADIITAARKDICIGEDMITGSTWTDHISAGYITITGSTMIGKEITIIIRADAIIDLIRSVTPQLFKNLKSFFIYSRVFLTCSERIVAWHKANRSISHYGHSRRVRALEKVSGSV